MKRFPQFVVAVAIAVLGCTDAGGPDRLMGPELSGPSFSVGGATVITDQSDYIPGDTVTISGTGWTPGEAVRLQITENPPNHPDHHFDAIADANGDILHRGLVMDENHAGVTFTLTATGQASGLVATTTFTDAITGAPVATRESGCIAPDAEFTLGETVCAVAGPLTISGGGNNDFRIRWIGPSPSTAILREKLFTSVANGSSHIDTFTPAAAGEYTVQTVAGTSGDAVRSSAVFTVQLADQDPPSVTNVQVNPNPTNGTTDVVLTATATDTHSSIASAEYNIDGGSFAAMSAVDLGFNELSEDVTVTIAAAVIGALSEGQHTLCIRATDAASNTSGQADACTSLLVDKTPPVVSNVEVTPNPVQNGNATVISATISDALSNVVSAEYSTDGGQTWNAFAAFPSAATVNLNQTVTLATGVYDICVRATDTATNTSDGQSCTLLAVYDPSAGFVTGGGWLWSPVGASIAYPAAEGKATFGFVSKYKKGATVPEGQTQFQFRAADLNFHGDVYEWLVVAGARAQYKGEGTVNGAGRYGFLLTAIDGQVAGGGGVDRLRIKIWDVSTSVILYDNQIGKSDTGLDATALGGGSIVIHAK